MKAKLKEHDVKIMTWLNVHTLLIQDNAKQIYLDTVRQTIDEILIQKEKEYKAWII